MSLGRWGSCLRERIRTDFLGKRWACVGGGGVWVGGKCGRDFHIVTDARSIKN